MKIIQILRLSIVLSFIFASCDGPTSSTQTGSLTESEKVIEQKIDSLMALMTLQEKIGQLNQLNGDFATGPVEGRSGEAKEEIKAGRVGSFLNFAGTVDTRRLQKLAVEESRLGIPLLFALDIIHGYRTIFPISLAESCSWDMEAIEQSARIAATEASAEGLHWTFAPMVDIARDPRWGRISEGAGEDPYLGGKVAAARIRGFQGDDLTAKNTILACAKHFVGYGAAYGGRDYNTVDISDRELRDTYLPPFKVAADAGVATFMTSFNEIFDMPVTGSEYVLDEILRKEWGYHGMVVSDWASVTEMLNHGVAVDRKAAAKIAINAGTDMEMFSQSYVDHLEELVNEGGVSEATIDRSVRRVLRVKYWLGLFDDPYRYIDEEREKTLVMTEEHLAAAREIASKSMVLLKNENNLLPLSASTNTIAIVGPLADKRNEMLGSWAAKGDWRKAVTPLEGIREAAQNSRVLYAKGCNINDDSTQYFNTALQAARQADVVVAVMGESASMSGEAASRAYLDLPGVQKDFLKELKKTGKPIVLVVMNGRPLTLTWEDENMTAILETWFPGTQAGHAMADVLFGKYNPAGKLTTSFPVAVGQIPVHYNYKNTGRPATDHRYTSKYLDIPNEPLYPFGYGLSYTTFEYDPPQVSAESMPMDGSLEVKVTVTNTGDREGEEVVQLYIQDMVASISRPVKELKSFKKIMLAPSAAETVTFQLDAADFAYLTKDMEWKADPGNFKIMSGPNSRDVQEVRFAIK